MGNSTCVHRIESYNHDKAYLMEIIDRTIFDLENQHNNRLIDLNYATIDGIPLYLFWIFYGINTDVDEYFRKMQFLYNHCRIDHDTNYRISLVPHVNVNDVVTIEIFSPKTEVPRYAITGKNTGVEMVRQLHRILSTTKTFKLNFSSTEVETAVMLKLMTTIQILSKTKRFDDVAGCILTNRHVDSTSSASFCSTNSDPFMAHDYTIPPTASVIDIPMKDLCFQQFVSYPSTESCIKTVPAIPCKVFANAW